MKNTLIATALVTVGLTALAAFVALFFGLWALSEHHPHLSRTGFALLFLIGAVAIVKDHLDARDRIRDNDHARRVRAASNES